jgi:hypothetical protein
MTGSDAPADRGSPLDALVGRLERKRAVAVAVSEAARRAPRPPLSANRWAVTVQLLQLWPRD